MRDTALLAVQAAEFAQPAATEPRTQKSKRLLIPVVGERANPLIIRTSGERVCNTNLVELPRFHWIFARRAAVLALSIFQFLSRAELATRSKLIKRWS